jgi:uncharacterized membrane protein YgcG
MNYFLLLLLLFPLLTNGQNFPKKPTNYVTVFDPFYTNKSVLSKHEEELLNAKLRAFEDSTTNQLFVYLTYSLFGKNLEDHSREIFNTWGIGQKDKNNGILIAIFIKDREYRIQVGYGLESSLPSDLCRQIQDENMGPRFKEGNFYEGIDAGVDQLIYYTKNKTAFKPKDPNQHLFLPVGIASAISLVFLIINLLSLKKWSNQPKRREKYLWLSIAFFAIPLLGPLAYVVLHLSNSIILLMPSIVGAFVSLLLCTVINDKNDIKYDNETDNAYERRMRMQRERDSSSDRSNDSFSGGGGGSSDSGGSSSRW